MASSQNGTNGHLCSFRARSILTSGEASFLEQVVKRHLRLDVVPARVVLDAVKVTIVRWTADVGLVEG